MARQVAKLTAARATPGCRARVFSTRAARGTRHPLDRKINVIERAGRRRAGHLDHLRPAGDVVGLVLDQRGQTRGRPRGRIMLDGHRLRRNIDCHRRYAADRAERALDGVLAGVAADPWHIDRSDHRGSIPADAGGPVSAGENFAASISSSMAAAPRPETTASEKHVSRWLCKITRLARSSDDATAATCFITSTQ